MADEREDWSHWLDRHGPALVLLARQWATCRADAEDIVQEAVVSCWRSRQRIDDPAAYLFRCVRHRALDSLRSRRRQERRELAVARPEAEPLFDMPIEQDERRLAIEAALRGLPASQAEVLVMKVWGELTFPQIASALEISVNTVASRYRYALARLREALAEESIR
jgi:RNA polymerase sigma-70 factor (ECF subfamily)